MDGARKKKTALRRGLSAIFLSAVLGAAVAGPLSVQLKAGGTQAVQTVDTAQQPAADVAPYVSPALGAPEASRALTAGETALLRGLFGDAIDLSAVRLHMFRQESPTATGTVPGGETANLEFHGRRNMPADFSRETGERNSEGHHNYGSFVMLMTAIWQNQQGANWRGTAAEGYEYTLAAGKSFADYGAAQQRAIMQDYALRVLHPSHISRWQAEKEGGHTRESDDLLRQTVELWFPAASETREALWATYARPMTAGETALARAVFGDAINLDNVRLYMHPEVFAATSATVGDGQSARFWGPREQSRDYSRESDARLFGNFMHEMLHIWQYQNNWASTPNKVFGVYRYTIGAKSKFTEYSVEQQAAIIEDYARHFLHNGRSVNQLAHAYSGAQLEARFPHLRKVVEDQFPAARAARLAFERSRAPWLQTRGHTPTARRGGPAPG